MSYEVLNIKKAESLNLINQQIEKGEILFKKGYLLIKGKSKYDISARDRDLFDSTFKQWVDITYSALSKVYKSPKYPLEFKEKHSSKVEYVNSSWIPDIEYYLRKQFVQKLDYLKMLRDSIDDFKDENEESVTVERKEQKADQVENLRTFFDANLRKAILRVPEKELDIQDTIEQLLIGRGFVKGVDYDRETGRVKVSIKEVVPDLIFPKLSMALEVKLAKTKSKSRSIVDEINTDIMSYGKRYNSILFIVYDMGTIRDESEFTRDLEVNESVDVIIVKH